MFLLQYILRMSEKKRAERVKAILYNHDLLLSLLLKIMNFYMCNIPNNYSFHYRQLMYYCYEIFMKYLTKNTKFSIYIFF